MSAGIGKILFKFISINNLNYVRFIRVHFNYQISIMKMFSIYFTSFVKTLNIRRYSLFNYLSAFSEYLGT